MSKLDRDSERNPFSEPSGSGQPSRSRILAGEQLLFGAVALQNKSVTHTQLISAFQAWVQDKSRTLADILQSQGAVTPQDCEFLNRLTAKLREKHKGSVEQSLAALSSVAQIRPELEKLRDPDLMASLDCIGRRTGGTDLENAHSAPHDTAHAPPEVVPSVADTLTWNLSATDVPGIQAETIAQATPQRLGRFVLQKILGQGGFGTVYLAHDPQLDRQVALKIPRAGTLNDDAAVQRFFREARAAAQLRHPYIVPVHDAGQAGDTSYIASGFIDGQSLRQRIKQGPPLTVRDSAVLISRLATALEYAHSTGIIHRDMKPDNIMLTQRDEPQILDFGLARRNFGDELRTQEGVRMGTPAYMSPEQASGQSHVADARSDLWALGVILYELLTGRRPFEGELVALLGKILGQDPAAPRKLNRAIPRDLETVCLKCLAKSPAQRFQTCGELADELDRWLRGEPIAARPISLAERAWRWSRRNPVVAGLAASLALVTVVGATVSLAFAVSASSKANDLAISLGKVTVATNKATAEAERATRLAGSLETSLSTEKLARKEAGHSLYISQMGLALQAFEQADLANVIQILEGFLPDEESEDLRGFEWYHLWYASHRESFHVDGGCRAMTCSPDGKTVAVQGADGETTLWSVDRHELLARFDVPLAGPTMHAGWHLAAGSMRQAVSVDSRLVAVARLQDRTKVDGPSAVRVYDLDSGKERHLLGQFERPVAAISFSPDGRQLAAAIVDGRVILWNVADGRERWSVHAGSADSKGIAAGLVRPYQSLAFSADGRSLLTVGFDDMVQLWDADHGKLQSELNHKINLLSTPMIETPAFSCAPDMRQIALVNADGTRLIWEPRVNRQLPISSQLPASGLSMAFSPDGSILAVAAAPVEMWNVANGERIADRWSSSTAAPTRKTHCVSFSPGGELLAAGRQDGRIQIIDMATQSVQIDFPGHDTSVEQVTFSRDGSTLLSRGRSDGVKIWSLAAIRETTVLGSGGGGGVVSMLAFSADGDQLTAVHRAGTQFGNEEGVLRRWNLTDGTEVPLAVSRVVAKVVTAQFSPEYNTNLMRVTHSSDISLSPDGSLVACGGTDSVVRVKNVASGEELLQFTPGQSTGYHIVFSTDGRQIAAPTSEGIKVWDIAEQREVVRLHDNRPAQLAFVPCAHALAEFVKDDLIFWDLTSGKSTRTIQAEETVAMGLGQRVFSRDGKMLVACESGESLGSDRRNRLGIWNSETGEEMAVRGSKAVAVAAIAFAPDGRSFVTLDRVARDEVPRMRFWNNQSRQEIGPLPRNAPQDSFSRGSGGGCVAFSPDGRMMARGNSDGSISLWRSASDVPKRSDSQSDPAMASPERKTSGVSGRFVRIELPGKDRVLTLAEVEVISRGRNVARAGRASQSSVEWGGTPDRAIDGNTSTQYYDNGQTHTKSEDGPWWEVDLLNEVPIKMITIWNRTGDQIHKRLDGFTLQVLDASRIPVFTKSGIPASPLKFAVEFVDEPATWKVSPTLVRVHVPGT